MLEQAFDTALMLNMVMNNLTSLVVFSLQNSALTSKKPHCSAAAGVSVPHPTCFTPVEIFCTATQFPHTQQQSLPLSYSHAPFL